MCHKLDQVIIFAGSWEIDTYLLLIIAHEDIFGSQKHRVWRQELHRGANFSLVSKVSEKLLAKQAGRHELTPRQSRGGTKEPVQTLPDRTSKATAKTSKHTTKTSKTWKKTLQDQPNYLDFLWCSRSVCMTLLMESGKVRHRPPGAPLAGFASTLERKN